jgi:hypothetical protein
MAFAKRHWKITLLNVLLLIFAGVGLTYRLWRNEAVAQTVPAAPAPLNAQEQSVAEARATGKYPERLTTLVAPKKFDPDAFRLNPQAYLDVVEPGRVWASAEPTPTARVIEHLGPIDRILRPLETTELTARVLAEAPVTFTSFSGGQFENHLQSHNRRGDNPGSITPYSWTGALLHNDCANAGVAR